MKSIHVQAQESEALMRRFELLVDEAIDTPSGMEIVSTLVDIGRMLVGKNKAYGDSALDPVRIVSKANPIEQILVRIDDKLSRLKRGDAAGEDVEHDLLGYFVLLRVARTRVENAMQRATLKRHVEIEIHSQGEGGT